MFSFYCYIHKLLSISLNNDLNPIPFSIKQSLKKKSKITISVALINFTYHSPSGEKRLDKSILKIFINIVDNIKVSFKSINILDSQLVNTKDKTNILDKNGCYMLQFNDVEALDSKKNPTIWKNWDVNAFTKTTRMPKSL